MTYRLEWENPPIEIDGFRVYRKEIIDFRIPTFFTLIYDSRLYSVSVLDTYEDSTAELSKSYQYAVSIIVGDQESSISVPFEVYAPRPEYLRRTGRTDTTITMAWDNPPLYPVDGYVIYRRGVVGPGIPFEAGSDEIYRGDAAPLDGHTDTGLTADTAYEYGVAFTYGGEDSLIFTPVEMQTLTEAFPP